MAVKLKSIDNQVLFFDLEEFTKAIDKTKQYKYVLLAVHKGDVDGPQHRIGVAANFPPGSLGPFLEMSSTLISERYEDGTIEENMHKVGRKHTVH